MKFFLFESDFQQITTESALLPVTLKTSVRAYFRWFLECVGKLGGIVRIDDAAGTDALKNLLGRPDAIFLKFTKPKRFVDWIKVPCRVLDPILGNLLVPWNLYDHLKYASGSHLTLFCTPVERGIFQTYLGDLMPPMGVFAPAADTAFFFPPDKKQRATARKKAGIAPGRVHLVYTGRWVTTKGIAQLVRLLDLWPAKEAVLTLAGNPDMQAHMQYSGANQATFGLFLDEEIYRGQKRPWLRVVAAGDRQAQRELLWSADLFIHPSVHPEECFGVAPREAAACGVPVVTTNFCGLKPLAAAMPWKGADTYPSLSGLRFGLKEFRRLIGRAIAQRREIGPAECHDFADSECGRDVCVRNLKEAVGRLSAMPPRVPAPAGKIEAECRKRFLSRSNPRWLELYVRLRQNNLKGNWAYGDASADPDLPMMQGIFCARNAPPVVLPKSRWRGFYRVGLLEKEKAVAEFGFPGPRLRRYRGRSWDLVRSCAVSSRSNDCVFIPRYKTQTAFVQELVDQGYLVGD